MCQIITEAYANTILSNEFVDTVAPVVLMSISDYVTIPVSSFSMSREFGAIAQSVSITIPNVNPDNSSDTGYYNSGRNSTAHNKPANDYAGIIKPGAVIYIKAGYGAKADTLKIFTGTIDTVKIKMSGSGESIIEINARCTGKKLVDGTIQRTITSTGAIAYWINYPITATVTALYLTSSDTNPYLYQIWVDVCRRAGWAEADIHWDTSWTMRLNDCDKDAFKMCTGSWADLANKIVDLLGAYMYEDEEGDIYLKTANDLTYTGSDTLSMVGTDWIPLEDGGGYRAIEESLVVEDFDEEFVRGVDYEFDYAKNAIRRIADGGITNSQYVDVSYNYCAWRYKPNQIFELEQWISHDECYGRIVATNTEKNLAQSTTLDALGDGSAISVIKALVEDHPELKTTAQLDAYLVAKRLEMRKHYYNINCSVVAIPHLRIRDLVCFLLWGTVTGIYEITGFNINYDAATGFQQQIEGVYYAASGVV